MYVTVSGAPTIETVNLVDVPSAAISTASSVEVQPYDWTGVAAADISPDTAITVTSYLTYTKVISVIEAPTTSATANQGSYYFTEENGTTAWLSDKTPPATDALVTGTTTVIVEPVPSGLTTSIAEAPATITSFSTVFLTLFSTWQVTETITETTYTAPASTRNLAGLGSSGWNNSFTTLQTIKVGPTATSVSSQWPPGDGFPYTIAQKLQTTTAAPIATSVSSQWPPGEGFPYTLSNTLQSEYSSSLSGSAASGSVSKNKMERQVGAILYATINGVAVSWTNEWDGGSSPTSITSASSTPALVASPYGFSLTMPETTPATFGKPQGPITSSHLS